MEAEKQHLVTGDSINEANSRLQADIDNQTQMLGQDNALIQMPIVAQMNDDISKESHMTQINLLTNVSKGQTSNQYQASHIGGEMSKNTGTPVSAIISPASTSLNQELTRQRIPVQTSGVTTLPASVNKGPIKELSQVNLSQLKDVVRQYEKTSEENFDEPMNSTRTPKTNRMPDSFGMPQGNLKNKSMVNTQGKEHQFQASNRKPGRGEGSCQPSYTDVMSIGTKHRPSFTQGSNNDIMLNEPNTTQIASKIETFPGPTVTDSPKRVKQGLDSRNVGFNQVATNDGHGTHLIATVAGGTVNISQNSFNRSLKQSSSFNQHPMKIVGNQNEHIISIFDKETEKSYLLERQVMQPVNSKGDKTLDNQKAIFKVQEIGTAKFKCLPITDYGKIMSLQKSRQRSKLHTADGTTRRPNRQTTTGKKLMTGRSSSNRHGQDNSGITSAETFHFTGQYRSRFFSNAAAFKQRTKSPVEGIKTVVQSPKATAKDQTRESASMARLAGQSSAITRSSKRTSTNIRKNITSDKSGAALTGITSQDLRNSRSTVVSGQRKEVFSKKKVLNEHGIPLMQRQAYRSNVPLTQTSSKAFTSGLGADILQMSRNYLEEAKLYNSKPNLSVTNYASPKTAAASGKAENSGVPSFGEEGTGGISSAHQITVQCCCPTNEGHNSSKTIGPNGAATNNTVSPYQNTLNPSMTICLNCETLTHSNAPNISQEKQFLRKRAQSQGGVRPNRFYSRADQLQGSQAEGNGVFSLPSGGMIGNKVARGVSLFRPQRLQKKKTATNRLMSIASDLRKNILPKQHNQINDILKQRLQKFLSLLTIHGEPNLNIVNTLFSQADALNSDQTSHLLYELLEQIKAQQIPLNEGNQEFYNDQGIQDEKRPLSEDDNVFQDLSMIENLRPLRMNIISSIRAMPSYYEGRQKKDPLKPKEFQMQLAHDKESNNNITREQVPSKRDDTVTIGMASSNNVATFRTNGDLSDIVAETSPQGVLAHSHTFDQRVDGNFISTQVLQGQQPQQKTQNTLQAVLNQNREKLISNQRNIMASCTSDVATAGIRQPIQQATNTCTSARLDAYSFQDLNTGNQNDIVAENKKKMIAISANEVDRMLFRAGLASPTVAKREQNEMVRRAWANRRVTQKPSKLKNIQALMLVDPPTSPLIKQEVPTTERTAKNQDLIDQQKSKRQSTSRSPKDKKIMQKNLENMRKVGASTSSQNSPISLINATIRKSLTLSQVKQTPRKAMDSSSDGLRVHSSQINDENLSPMDEEASILRLEPTQHLMLENTDENNKMFGSLNVQTHQYQSIAQPRESNPRQSFGPLDSHASTNAIPNQLSVANPIFGGVDLLHVLSHESNENSFNNGSRNQNFNKTPMVQVQDVNSGFVVTNETIPGFNSNQNSPIPSIQDPQNNQNAINVSETHRKLKTYEFHLPMHHIREEGKTRSPNTNLHPKKDRNAVVGHTTTMTAGVNSFQSNAVKSNTETSGGTATALPVSPSSNAAVANHQINLHPMVANQSASRYNLSKQSTVYRLTKKRTGLAQPGGARRDDISSQMLENETVADNQGSLRNLNFIGSSFYADASSKVDGGKREHQSHTAIRKKASSNDQRNQFVAQSLEALALQSKINACIHSNTNRRGGVGIVSQSIDMAKKMTHQTQVNSGEAKLQTQGTTSPNRLNEISPNSSCQKRLVNKKRISNLTNRARKSKSPEQKGTGRKQTRKGSVMQKNAAGIVDNNSPLICLSHQEFEQRAKAAIDDLETGTPENNLQSFNHQKHQKTRSIPHHAHLMRPKTNQTRDGVTGSLTGSLRQSGKKLPQKNSPKSSPRRKEVLSNHGTKQYKISKRASDPINHQDHIITSAAANSIEGRNTTQNDLPSPLPLQLAGKPDTIESDADLYMNELQLTGDKKLEDQDNSESLKSIDNTQKACRGDSPARTCEHKDSLKNHILMKRVATTTSPSPFDQPADAFLILHSAEGGHSEMLEINQRNFELFREQIDGAVKLTNSSQSGVSEAARQTLAAMNSLSNRIDQQMSSNEYDGQLATDPGTEHQIEVINISQAVQTGTQIGSNRADSNSDSTTPQISQLYVSNPLNYGLFASSVKNQGTGTESYIYSRRKSSMNNGEKTSSLLNELNLSSKNKEERLKILMEKLDERAPPTKKQLAIQQFSTKMPKRQSKSASGYHPNKRLQKQFKQPSFKHAQMFLPQGESKTNTEGGQSKIKFKTFKANNTLYLRVDNDNKLELDSNELRAYNALLMNIRTSAPNSASNLSNARENTARDSSSAQVQDSKVPSTAAGQLSTTKSVIDAQGSKQQTMSPNGEKQSAHFSVINSDTQPRTSPQFATLEFQHKQDGLRLEELCDVNAEGLPWLGNAHFNRQNAKTAHGQSRSRSKNQDKKYSAEFEKDGDFMFKNTKNASKVVYRRGQDDPASNSGQCQVLTGNSSGDPSGLSSYDHIRRAQDDLRAVKSGSAINDVNIANLRANNQPNEQILGINMSLQDGDCGSTVEGKVSNSNTTLVSQTRPKSKQYQNYQNMDGSLLMTTIQERQNTLLIPRNLEDFNDTISKGTQLKKTNGNQLPPNKLSSNITQPILQKSSKIAYKNKHSVDGKQLVGRNSQANTTQVSPLNRARAPFTSRKSSVQNKGQNSPSTPFRQSPTPGTPGESQYQALGFIRGTKVTSNSSGVKVSLVGNNKHNLRLGSRQRSQLQQEPEFAITGKNPAIVAENASKSPTAVNKIGPSPRKVNIDVLDIGNNAKNQSNFTGALGGTMTTGGGVSRVLNEDLGDQSSGKFTNIDSQIKQSRSRSITPQTKSDQKQMTQEGMIQANQDGNYQKQSQELDGSQKTLTKGTKSTSKRRPANNLSNKPMKMSDLVLKVYAEKQNNRRQATALYFPSKNRHNSSSSERTGPAFKSLNMNAQKGSNKDLPFTLGRNSNSNVHQDRKVVSNFGSMKTHSLAETVIDKSSAVNSHTELRSSSPEDHVQSAASVHTLSQKDLLRHLLHSRPGAKILVPKGSEGAYQNVGKQGLDRAINFIQFDHSTNPHAQIADCQIKTGGQTSPQAHENLLNPSEVKPTKGFMENAGQLSSIESSRMHSVRGSPKQRAEEIISGQSVGTIGIHDATNYNSQVHHNQIGPATFGSMVLGKPCLEPKSLNQSYLQRYEEAMLLKDEKQNSVVTNSALDENSPHKLLSIQAMPEEEQKT